MNAPEPKLSIVIPLFNTEKYIEECIKSIVESAIDPTLYEVIVVDDGSTDNSARIVEQLCGTYRNISQFRQENQGVSAARMKGIGEAKGEYIWFIDSDDYLLPGALEKAFSTLSEHTGIDAIVAPMMVINDATGYSAPNFLPAHSYMTTGKQCLQNGPVLIAPPQFIIRHSLFEKESICFPRGIRYEDEYFARALQYHLQTVFILNECLYVYRQLSNSFMGSADINTLPYMLSAYQALQDFITTDVSKEDQGWFRANIFGLITEMHTRFTKYYNTPTFKAFRKKNLSCFKKELKLAKRNFSIKDRLLSNLLLFNPALHYRITRLYSHIKKKYIS